MSSYSKRGELWEAEWGCDWENAEQIVHSEPCPASGDGVRAHHSLQSRCRKRSLVNLIQLTWSDTFHLQQQRARLPLLDSVKQLTVFPEVSCEFFDTLKSDVVLDRHLISVTIRRHLISDAGLNRTCQNCHILSNTNVTDDLGSHIISPFFCLKVRSPPHLGESCPKGSSWRPLSTSLRIWCLKLMGSLLPFCGNEYYDFNGKEYLLFQMLLSSGTVSPLECTWKHKRLSLLSYKWENRK